MSVNYAEGLSPYDHKGRVNLKEFFDSDEEFQLKLDRLAALIGSARHLVVHTGAGVSTSAGIPDFRGPNGVWTLEERGEKPGVDLTWEDAVPTPTHMALVELERRGILKFVVTQNVDGLHLRSGFPRDRLACLHGDVFVEECDRCGAQFVGSAPVPTMAQRRTGKACEATRPGGRRCRGRLRDTILDWEADLPRRDIDAAEENSRMADVNLTLGTSLQILPAGKLPTLAKRGASGALNKLVVVSLSETKQDKKADLKIHARVDDVMRGVMKRLGIEIPEARIARPVLRSRHPLEDSKLSVETLVQCGRVVGEEVGEGKVRCDGEARTKRSSVDDEIIPGRDKKLKLEKETKTEGIDGGNEEKNKDTKREIEMEIYERNEATKDERQIYEDEQKIDDDRTLDEKKMDLSETRLKREAEEIEEVTKTPSFASSPTQTLRTGPRPTI